MIALNPWERGPEYIPTKDEVMEIIRRHTESRNIVSERSDEQGLYLLEVKVEGERPGETIQYEYMRKGTHAPNIVSTKTNICRVYYRNGQAHDGEEVAICNTETGEWKEAE